MGIIRKARRRVRSYQRARRRAHEQPLAPVLGAAGSSIQLRDVVLDYGGDPVLQVAHLDLHPGQVTALIGPNGAGKSTLLAAIAGLHVPTAGTVRVLGRLPQDAHARVAMVLQSTTISPHLPVTVTDVVAMGRYPARGMFQKLTSQDRGAIYLALERLGIVDLRNRRIQELSGGQRQRVIVAQGLAQEAEVLLLDEPVSGLDQPSQERILRVITDEANLGRTVVVSTHDLAEASGAGSLVLLAGRVVAAGAPASVLTEANLTAAYGSRLVRLGSGVLLDDGSHHAGPGHTH